MIAFGGILPMLFPGEEICSYRESANACYGRNGAQAFVVTFPASETRFASSAGLCLIAAFSPGISDALSASIDTFVMFVNVPYDRSVVSDERIVARAVRPPRGMCKVTP